MYSAVCTYSDYSLLQSCFRIEDLVALAKAQGYSAIALTDYNNVGGLVSFYHQCRTHQIKPILGGEFTLANVAGLDSLTLLARNEQGYEDLMEIASQPRPLECHALTKFNQGLIALPFFQEIDSAHTSYQQLTAVFGDENVYIPLLMGSSQQREISTALLSIFPKNILIASQKAYYHSAKDKPILQVMQAIADGCEFEQVDIRMFSPLYSSNEFAQQFRTLPWALENLATMVNRCDLELVDRVGLPSLPDSPSLEELAWTGAKKRYPNLDPAVKARLDYELRVISEMGFSDYFIIVADIVGYARSKSIPVGPGRGSAAGSLVAYCLGITDIDPMYHGLVFERFLNKQRQTMPDIDLDFCYMRRGEVLEYVKKRFGSRRVAHIGTYGTFGYRLAVREVGKAFGLTQTDIGRLLANEKRTSNFLPHIQEIVQGLIGLKRHFSTHAAGILICPDSITKYCGVLTQRDTMAVTQMPMESVAQLGLLKIDLLGLRNLTIIQATQEYISKHHPSFSLNRIPYDDLKTFEMLAAGDSHGVFQLESKMYRDILVQMKPGDFRDLVALLALGRPGPMSQIPTYIARQAGQEVVEYSHPDMRPVLADTYGLMVYQEQVMKIANQLGGLSLEEADLLRSAMSKKNKELIQGFRQRFLEGCERKEIDRGKSDAIFTQMERFADYAFNKAHSTAYAYITYQTAYLRANYPLQFYMAHLNFASQAKRSEYLWHCRRLNIPLLPPDIRYSQVDCTQEGQAIRIGLGCLRHINTQSLMDFIIERENKEFTSFREILSRSNLSGKILETLVKAGACDGFIERSQGLSLCSQRYRLSTESYTSLELLIAEKEIVGLHVSEHPVCKWNPFLQRIGKAFPHMLAGDIASYQDPLQEQCGWIGDIHGLQPFQLSHTASAFRLFIAEGSLVALFGEEQDGILWVEWILPLRPMLVLQPKLEELAKLQTILAAEKGDIAFVLNISKSSIQLVPPKFWIKFSQNVVTALSQYCYHYQWINPWNEGLPLISKK